MDSLTQKTYKHDSIEAFISSVCTIAKCMEFCNGYFSHLGFSHFAQGVRDLKVHICLGY